MEEPKQNKQHKMIVKGVDLRVSKTTASAAESKVKKSKLKVKIHLLTQFIYFFSNSQGVWHSLCAHNKSLGDVPNNDFMLNRLPRKKTTENVLSQTKPKTTAKPSY